MLPLAPFIAGAAIGAGVVMLLGNKKTQEKLNKGKEYVSGKFSEGKEFVEEKLDEGVTTAKAIGKCVNEKRFKKEGEATTEENPA